MKGYRRPEQDNYGWARLCQVIGNYFGGELSIGIDKYECLDTNNWDNGVYIIEDWEIVDREFNHGSEQQEYDLYDMLIEINKAQPESERLKEDVIKDYVDKVSLNKPTEEDQSTEEDPLADGDLPF